MFKKALFIVLAFILALAAVAVFAYSRMYYPTGEIMPGIYAIKTGGNGIQTVNAFLFEVDGKYMMIDAGANLAQTENQLRTLGISADDVVAVFITHSDDDHVGALGLFGSDIIQAMSDGEVMEVSGISVQCIYTPGHTEDSVCYLMDGKYLFTGDAFFNPRYDRELHAISKTKILETEGVEWVFTGHFGLFKDIRFFRWWFG